MAETIAIRCDNCDSTLRLSGREVLVASFLKTALGLGWCGLDTDADVSQVENVTCIKLGGLCPDCLNDAREAVENEIQH